jgi:uncharacterized protein YidB (DUF937 family)
MSFMNVLTDLVGRSSGSADGQPTTQQHASVVQALLEHFGQQPGGLGAVAEQFRQNGMGSHVDSWLSPQANQPLAPQQVEQGLGSDHLASIAQRAGISPEIAKVALAAGLPLLMSHLAHGSGQLPDHASDASGLSGLAQSLFSRAL